MITCLTLIISIILDNKSVFCFCTVLVTVVLDVKFGCMNESINKTLPVGYLYESIGTDPIKKQHQDNGQSDISSLTYIILNTPTQINGHQIKLP